MFTTREDSSVIESSCKSRPSVSKEYKNIFHQNSDAFCLFLLPLDGRYINDRQQSGTKSQVWL